MISTSGVEACTNVEGLKKKVKVESCNRKQVEVFFSAFFFFSIFIA